MRNAGRYESALHPVAAQVDQAGHPEGRRPVPEIVQTEHQKALDRHEVVGVYRVDMNAAQGVGLGLNEVPLQKRLIVGPL